MNDEACLCGLLFSDAGLQAAHAHSCKAIIMTAETVTLRCALAGIANSPKSATKEDLMARAKDALEGSIRRGRRKRSS